jgi:hypothetical protein
MAITIITTMVTMAAITMVVDITEEEVTMAVEDTVVVDIMGVEATVEDTAVASRNAIKKFIESIAG